MIFHRSDSIRVSEIIEDIGGAKELPFIPESDARMKELLALAIIGIECENSLWKAAQMPAFNSELRPQKRLGGRLGLPKGAVLPTVIVKDQDLKPLQQWQSSTGVPIHVWHSFYDRAYGLPLSRLEQLIADGLIEPTVQVFQAPGGATTKKAIFKIYYHYAYELGMTIEEPQLVADSITDKNGHIMPYVRFSGGKMKILQTAINEVDAEARAKK